MTDAAKLTFLDPALILIGIVLLYTGAEGLVRGAYRITVRLGVTPLVAGLTVVSLCTSLPEAFASFVAQLTKGYGNIAVGNVIGSNIANVGLILGISALVRPLPAARVIVVRDMPLMIASCLLLTLFMIGEDLGRVRGIILVLLLIAYVWFQVHMGKREADLHHLAKPLRVKHSAPQIVWDSVLVTVGVALLLVGADLLVRGSVGLARYAGLSNSVIGLTIVAVGTSLPELAASAVAAYRRHADIALGNVIGSNVFNALFITGGVAAISPITFDRQLLIVDAPIMLFFCVFLWILFWIRPMINRVGGALLIVMYAIYLAFSII